MVKRVVIYFNATGYPSSHLYFCLFTLYLQPLFTSMIIKKDGGTGPLMS